MKLTPEQVMDGLVKRGVPAHVAQGVVLNFQDESGLNTDVNEKAPIVKGSRGGYGLAQWTGPRRLALEEFADNRGVPVSDPDLQLDFFMQENAGSERAAWARVMASRTPQEAAANFVTHWERPAPEHRQARVAKYMGGVALPGVPFVPQPSPPKPAIPSMETGSTPSPPVPASPARSSSSLLSYLRMKLAQLFTSS